MKKQIIVDDLLIPKFRKLLYDKEHTHIILTSGRAGTKSSAVSIIANAKLISDPNCSIVVLRKHHNKLRKTVYKEFLRAIKRMGLNKKKHYKVLKSPLEIQYKKNENTVYFTGNDSIDDTKGIIDENKPIKIVILDELTEFFDDGEGEDELSNISATFVRGNDDEFKMIYLFNPPKNPNAPVMQWVRKMEQRPDTIHIHVDYRDVPESWLGKKLIQEAEAMKKVAEKMYQWVWLGLCTGIDDLIYHMLSYQHIRVPPKDIGIIGIGVDYGQKNATTYQAIGVGHDHCLYGLMEYYHSGRDEGAKSPSAYAKDFKEFCRRIHEKYGHYPQYVFIDPSAQGLGEEIARVCPGIIIKNADNRVSVGISRVQKLLSFQRLFLSPEQKTLQEEMKQYQWDPDSVEKGEEKPLKVFDHACDAERYAVAGLWVYIKNSLPFTEKED